MTTKKPKKTTQKALAKALGISPQLVSYHVRAGCNVPLNDADAWRDYLAEVGREGSLPKKLREEIGKARARLIRAQAERAERENAIAAGEVVQASEAVRQANEAGALFMNSLEKLCRELPPLLAGLPTSGVAARMEAEIENVRRHLKIKLAEIG